MKKPVRFNVVWEIIQERGGKGKLKGGVRKKLRTSTFFAIITATD
jgi:hypothetical protein